MMMPYLLASGPSTLEQILAPWAQIAAIILVIELFLFVLIFLALNVGFTFLSTWVREKSELVKKLRPMIDNVNATTEAASKGTLPAAKADENKVVRTVAEIPARANAIEEKINEESDRVARAVIEFRARTVMVQGIVKAFFLPGLTRPAQSHMGEIKGQEPRMLLEEHPPEVAAGDGYVELAAPGKAATPVSSIQHKDAPVD
jgi:hypothetical protein